MVIISALASEYCGRLAVAPIDILRGLAGRLSLYHGKRTHFLLHNMFNPDCLPAAVQEACLLSMLRIVADCEEVSPEVIKSVTDAEQGASQYIRRVSFMYISLVCLFNR
jgi:AP-4 complex subunit epsilon-1